ncbi:unnamed protein product [Malus baccata var. baccata]
MPSLSPFPHESHSRLLEPTIQAYSELSEVLRKLGDVRLEVLDVGITAFEVGRFSWNFSSDTYPEDERIQRRHGGYDPSTYQTMPSRREPRRTSESNFPDITQLGEAMAHAFQNAIRPSPPPQRTPLETMYNLKLDRFMGNEGHEGAKKWLDHIEKTQAQFMSPEMASDWEVFKENFKKRFVPPKYIDRKKQEFTLLKQKNMSVHEYYRKFTDLSRYDPDTAGNQILVRMEDFDNLLSNSKDEEDKNDTQRRDDRGKGIFTQGPRKTQTFKRSGASSSSSSGGFSITGPMRGGRFTGGPRFQRPRDFGGAGGSGAPLCRRCNFWHHGECRRNGGGGGCYTCGQMGHRAA